MSDLESLLKQLTAEKIFGRPVLPVDRVAIIRKIQEIAPVRTYELLMPLLFTLRGKPLTLNDYRPFSPLMYADRPKQLIVKSGRQVGKSLNLSVSSILLPGQNPSFNTLVVTPLAEQVRRIMTIYVKPLMQDSTLPSLWFGPGTRSTLYQHEFPNRSNLILSFASLSADRIRGIAADAVFFDEIQDFDPDHLPVITSTTDASQYGLIQYTGTPKSLDNTLHGLWLSSSQAEWVTKCPACGYWNIPAAEYDLLDMIGPWHENISEECPATLCAKCRRPVNPRFGHWEHRYPDKKERFAGYHIPQVILPLHFASKNRWRTLLEKQHGASNTSTALFYNEILGESVDAGQKLVTVTDLNAAGCLPWTNNPNNPSPEIRARRDRYLWTTLSADWSGGGEKGISFTVLTFLGILPDGTVDCLWGKRLTSSLDHVAEAQECLYWMKYFRADSLTHDYGGAGSLRETFLIQAGVPEESIVPVEYVTSAKYNLITVAEPTKYHSRRHYRADKSRSLLYTAGSLSRGMLRFFKYDGGTANSVDSLMDDYLALYEESTVSFAGTSRYMIKRHHSLRDDFAQAVNIGCLSLWHTVNKYPDFTTGEPNARELQYSRDIDYDQSIWDASI